MTQTERGLRIPILALVDRFQQSFSHIESSHTRLISAESSIQIVTIHSS